MKTEQFSQLPDSIQNVLNEAIGMLKPEQIILFGSRARGDHRENSDFDIAFKGIKDKSIWNQFLLKISEDPLTLYKLDLVRIETLSKDYHDNIKKDGVVLYG